VVTFGEKVENYKFKEAQGVIWGTGLFVDQREDSGYMSIPML